MKAKQLYEEDKNGGWTDWEHATYNKDRMACCECGLTHDIEFKHIKGKGIFWRVKRNLKSTSNIRRWKYE